ncbi:hypothetical protein [Tritonibacter horizontis]
MTSGRGEDTLRGSSGDDERFCHATDRKRPAG